MTTPRPSPAPPAGRAGKISGALGGLVVAPTGSGGDTYGLGTFRDSALTPGDLGFPVPTDSNGTVTATALVEAFLHAPPGVVASIQQRLYQSGAYTGDYNPMLHPGLIRPEDVAAFTSTVKVAAQQSTSDTPINFAGYLNASAQFGATTGKAAASLNYGTNIDVVTHQNPNYLNLTADSVAQEVLGRKATDQERARFAALFDKTDVGRQIAAFSAQDKAHAAQYQRELDANNPQGPPSGPAGSQLPAVGPDIPAPRLDPHLAARLPQEDRTAAAQPSPGVGVDQFMKAIGGQESRGNYNEVNPDSGAQGKFQIMPGNWPSWSREAGLGPDAARTPANQERVARYKMNQYFQQFGSWDAVAVAWYAGPGAAQEWLRNPNASRFTRPQGSGANTYPSINDYVAQVRARTGTTGTMGVADPAYGVDQPNIPISQRVDVTDTNPAADANAFFRKAHPVEAGAKDVANTFDVFTKILQGRQ